MAERKRKAAETRDYARLREYKATEAPGDGLARYGAHSIGIGRKESGGSRSDTLALRFYVDRKERLDRLSGRAVPESVSFFSRQEGKQVKLATDVIETPRPVPEQDPETRIRPVPGGVSFGRSGSTGTLGGWAWDTTDDTLVALTNNHVLLNTIGADTLQQGTADGGSLPADKIGDVKRSIARIAPGTNLVDAAISDVDDAEDVDSVVLEIGPAVYARVTGTLDMEVEKFGQTTRHTFGEITDADLETTSSDGFAFDQQLFIGPIDPSDDWSAGGDSGSLVFRQEPSSGEIKPAVGLHWGGSGANGVACRLENVFSALDLTTICAGLFAALIDGLSETEAEGEAEPATERRIRTLSALAPLVPSRPLAWTPRARRRASAWRANAGLGRDVQKRLRASKSGRALTDLVDEHRVQLVHLLLRNGDVRRATVATLRPLVAGATTSTDVLTRTLTAKDLRRLDRLAAEVARHGDERLSKSLAPLQRMTRKAEGRTPAEVLELDA